MKNKVGIPVGQAEACLVGISVGAPEGSLDNSTGKDQFVHQMADQLDEQMEHT